MSPRRSATPLRNLALALASTLLFGGLLEGIARFLEPPPVQKQEYLWDWSEHFAGGDFYTLEKGEGYPPNEENNVDGLRDATRPVETRAGLRRVAILGDSVAYGHGLEAAQAFPQVLERRLRDDGRDVDVFNIALPGWSTRQESIAYERIARRYKPDTVVLAVCLNDLAELQINLTKPPRLLLELFKRSALVRASFGASRRDIGAVEELFSDAGSGRVENAFRLFNEEVTKLNDEVLKDGARLHIVVFPFRFQVEPSAPEPSVQRKMAEFAAGRGISFFDFLPEIAPVRDASHLFLDYDHFNVSGHERVARWLGRSLQLDGDGSAKTSGSLWPTDAGLDQGLSASRLLSRIKTPASQADRERLFRTIRTRTNALPAADPSVRALKAVVVSTAVDDPSPRVRFEAAQAAFALGLPDPPSVDALIRGVRHDDPRVRAFATWTLGEMGEAAKPAVPALVALARQDGGAGKTGAITAIGKIGGDSPEVVSLLLDELKHPKEAHRYRAARTLGKMGPAAASAVPGLVEALRDPSPLVRLNAVRALGNLGDPAKAALPALIGALNTDVDKEVRKEAGLAISKLPGR